MSLIPTHLHVRRCSIICHTIFSVSIRLRIASFGIHECLGRKKARFLLLLAGCVSFILYFWLSVDSLSSPASELEGWWPANVGIHSYIITKCLPVASSTSSELLFSVVLVTPSELYFFAHVINTCYFCIPCLCLHVNYFFLCQSAQRIATSSKNRQRLLLQDLLCYSINVNGCSSNIY